MRDVNRTKKQDKKFIFLCLKFYPYTTLLFLFVQNNLLDRRKYVLYIKFMYTIIKNGMINDN